MRKIVSAIYYHLRSCQIIPYKSIARSRLIICFLETSWCRDGKIIFICELIKNIILGLYVIKLLLK